MKYVIIAPHPDDEWIGCGCTILKKIKEGKKILVLVATKPPKTQRRIKISRKLAKKHSYSIKFLMENEKNIDENNLANFFRQNIEKKDVVFIPDMDIHPNHRTVCRVALENLKNKKIQYCVYNNSLNFFMRFKNIITRIFCGMTPSSFRKGSAEFYESYGLETKNKYISEFGEAKRGRDTLRNTR